MFQNNGWEIASHSLGHPSLVNIPLDVDDAKLSNWAYTGNAGIYKAQYNYPELKYMLQDGDNFNIISKGGDRLIKADSMEQLINFANNNIGSFFYDSSNKTVYIRTKNGDDPNSHVIQANSAERELYQSKLELQYEGLEVSSFLVPYSQWNTQLRDLSLDFYSAVASTKGNFVNTIPPLDSHWLSRRWPKDNEAVETIQSWIQDAIDKEYWLILGFHNIADGFFSKEKFDQLAAWVAELEKSGEIDVLTIREGVAFTQVPLPASLWFFSFGLSSLAAFALKRRSKRYRG